MSKLLRFLIRLRDDLSSEGPLRKRTTVRFLKDRSPRTVTVEADEGGEVSVVLRPHLVIRRPAEEAGGATVESTAVPLGAVLEIQIEEWDPEAPESVVTTRWVRDRHGRFHPIVEP